MQLIIEKYIAIAKPRVYKFSVIEEWFYIPYMSASCSSSINDNNWQVLSRDSVTVTVDAVVYYRVSNPTMATNNVEDFRYIQKLLNGNVKLIAVFALLNFLLDW